MHFVIFNLNNCFQFSGTFELCVTFCSCSGVLALVGKVDFTVMHLSSGTANFPSTWSFSSSQPCIGSGARQVKKHLYWWLLSSFKFCFYLVDFDQHEQQAINILKIILYFPVFSIFRKSFSRDDMDHACYLPRICCCSCYHRWICSFHCTSILQIFKLLSIQIRYFNIF